MTSADRPETRLATRLAFFVAGFGIACWAPLVPFAKARLNIDDAVLGLLLLCLGVGSVVAMVLTGIMSARFGSKPLIIVAGLASALLLPLLAIAGTPLTLGLSLFAFGAAIGSLDVAMNIHAVEVEHAAGRPIMSGFHALYSVGGFAGSSAVTFLLSMMFGALASTLWCAALMIVAMILAWPRLLRSSAHQGGPLFAVPRGIVLALAGLTAIIFLVEGAMLDWSALYLTGAGLVPETRGGIGFMVFSVAMVAGRFAGDAIVARLGDRATLIWGSLLTLAGLLVLVAAPAAIIAMAGFLLIGLGASNIVPVLFRRAGAQTVMPIGLAVSAVTTAGYAGILLGPAMIGFIAQIWSLAAAFWMLAALVAVVALSAPRVTASRR